MNENDATMEGKEQGWRRITNWDYTNDIDDSTDLRTEHDDLFKRTDHIQPFVRRHTIDYHIPIQRPGMGQRRILGHGRMWIWTGRRIRMERQIRFDRRRFEYMYTLHKTSIPPCKRSHDVFCKVYISPNLLRWRFSTVI